MRGRDNRDESFHLGRGGFDKVEGGERQVPDNVVTSCTVGLTRGAGDFRDIEKS